MMGFLLVTCSDPDLETLETIEKSNEDPTESAPPNGRKPKKTFGGYWGSEKSGSRLTKTNYDDHMIYYTHDSWSYDRKWIIFISDRDNGKWNIFAMKTSNYQIYQLTDINDFSTNIGSQGRSTEDVVLSRTRNYLYYIRANNGSYVKLVEMNFGKLLADAVAGTVKSPSNYERVFRTYSSNNVTTTGGISLDKNELYVYTGLDYGSTTKLNRVRIANGASNTAHTSYKFSIGHIAANPWVSNEILFDYKKHPGTPYDYTPSQRIHFVRGDGGSYRRIYQRGNGENPTHETWVNANTIGFNITLRNDSDTEVRGYFQISKWNAGLVRKARWSTSSNDEYSHNTKRWGYSNEYILDVVQVKGCGSNCTYATKQLYRVNTSNGQKIKLTNFLDAHAHQRVHPLGTSVLFENKSDNHYNLNLKNL